MERLRLDELLGSYDRDGNAGLDEQELGRLARNLLNEDLTAQGTKYLMVGSCALQALHFIQKCLSLYIR